MPHITIEYTANLERRPDLPAVFAAVHEVLSAEGGIAMENCKSRALRLESYWVGSGTEPSAFVHVDVRFLEGRSQETRNVLGRRILDITRRAFSDPNSTLDPQVTVWIREIARDSYFKFPEGTLDYDATVA